MGLTQLYNYVFVGKYHVSFHLHTMSHTGDAIFLVCLENTLMLSVHRILLFPIPRVSAHTHKEYRCISQGHYISKRNYTCHYAKNKVSAVANFVIISHGLNNSCKQLRIYNF